MFVHQIEFLLPKKPSEELSDMVFAYLCSLRMNGQVAGREWSLYFNNNRYISVVMTPERDSLKSKWNGFYVKQSLEKLHENKIVTSSQMLAEDTQSLKPCRCKNSSAYVLHTDYLTLESPVHCLDCFQPIPLYKLPKMPSKEYYELISWASDYKSCDSLQMNCQNLERAATRQISDVNSSLSKAGRAHCKTLETLTGKPFYYHLYRSYNGKLALEKKRVCPSCGGQWYLEKPLHRFFDFKCDKCLLLSNLGV